MSSRKISRKDLLSGCEAPGPDDGHDPRLDARPGPEKVANRKALQLCAQVARTLAEVLAGGGDVLRDLQVESVTPAPNASRLLVTVSRSAVAGDIDAEEILRRLEGARGMLRGEVAAAVNRRRVPDLVFRLREPAG
jgi:ribosome-binding factor A